MPANLPTQPTPLVQAYQDVPTPVLLLQQLCRANAAGSTARSDGLVVAEPNLTRIMFEAVDARAAAGQAQAGGAGGRTTYQALLAADQAWSNLRNMEVSRVAGYISVSDASNSSVRT